MAGLPRKDTERLLKALEEQGCRVVRRNGKAIVYAPDGAIKSVHFTNSDRNASKEQRSWVKRHGLEWPWD